MWAARSAVRRAAFDFARTLATRNPGPIADGKSAILRHLEMELPAAYDLASEVMIGHFMDPARIADEKESRWSDTR